MACALRDPFQPLPYLFLYGGENCGKSTFHESFSCLITKGIESANQALTSQSGFNGELAGAIIAYVEEIDISKTPGAHSKLKEWVVARMIPIRRMLLVTDADGKIQGLITSRDIQGEKPMKILEKTGGSFRDLLVGDLMTLKSKLEVLLMGDVLRAKVGDIIATLKEVDRQHAIVVDTDPHSGELAVRGIFSLAQIGRQLGLEISPTQRATTFADLEWAMHHHS